MEAPVSDTYTDITVRPPGSTAAAQGGGWSAVADPVESSSWEAHAEPVGSLKDTAIDVAKSAGVGVVRGALGLGGFLGEVTNLGAKGIEKLTNAVGKHVTGDEPYKRPEGGSILDKIPTTESLTKTLEGYTGELRQPETTAGRYAQTIGEFVPAALAGPGGIARKMATQAVIPGLASEAAGHATQGTALEPYARAGAGMAAGIAGAVAGAPNSAAGAIRSQLPKGIDQAVINDARSLMLNAKAKGIDLTWPEALSQVAGKPVMSDTMRILESAPASRARMQDFYAQRPQQMDRAGLDEFTNIAPGTATPSEIGPQIGRTANEALGDGRKAINTASEPHYAAAESVLLTPQEMAHVKRIPGFKDARDAVRSDPMLNWRVKHLPDNSVGFLNEIKKHFDTAGQNAGSKFNQAKNQQVQSSNEMAASAVKQIAEVKSPDYAHALLIQSEGRKALQPLLDGPLGRLAKKDMTTQKAIDVLFPSSPLPNSHHEISQAVSALASRHPGAAQQLVRAHMESVFNEATKSLQTGPNQFGAAKFANRLVGNMQQRTNLQAAVEALPNGKDLWRGLDSFLEAAEATGTRQGKGSLTAFNAQELKSMSGSNVVGEAVKTGLSPGKWLSVVNDKWGQWKLGRNLDQLAHILTDPKSAPVLKRIAAMPVGSRGAQYLVSRLILQGENAAVQPREPRGK